MSRQGNWTQQEDKYLLELVQDHGAKNWVRISQLFKHRSARQCREHYKQTLNPLLKHGPISDAEGEIVKQMVAEGKGWAEIARCLGNRSDSTIKNWYSGTARQQRMLPQAGTKSKQIIGASTQLIPFEVNRWLPQHPPDHGQFFSEGASIKSGPAVAARDEQQNPMKVSSLLASQILEVRTQGLLCQLSRHHFQLVETTTFSVKHKL